jgi:hypothetical protein
MSEKESESGEVKSQGLDIGEHCGGVETEAKGGDLALGSREGSRLIDRRGSLACRNGLGFEVAKVQGWR